MGQPPLCRFRLQYGSQSSPSGRRGRWPHNNDPVGPTVHRLAIAFVVVGLGHVTHFMHIFHESHVPSQQT